MNLKRKMFNSYDFANVVRINRKIYSRDLDIRQIDWWLFLEDEIDLPPKRQWHQKIIGSGNEFVDKEDRNIYLGRTISNSILVRNKVPGVIAFDDFSRGFDIIHAIRGKIALDFIIDGSYHLPPTYDEIDRETLTVRYLGWQEANNIDFDRTEQFTMPKRIYFKTLKKTKQNVLEYLA